MPITTSVITGTVAHKHSATGGSGDGGKLATGGLGGDTSFDLANGSLMFSNGTSIDDLVIGGAGTVLTEAGGVPTWAATGGSPYALIGSTSLGGAASTISLSFTAVNQSDVSEFIIVLNGSNTGGLGLKCRLNGLVSNYDFGFMQNASGTGTFAATTGETSLEVIAGAQHTQVLSIMHLACNTVGDHLMGSVTSVSETCNTFENFYNTTASQTSLSSVEFFVTSGTGLASGTRLEVYKVLQS